MEAPRETCGPSIVSAATKFGYVWDDGQQAWLDHGGEPVDPEAESFHFFLPRINAYFVDDVPAL